MGVRHLQTFIERRVKGGTYPVQMDRQIKAANNGLQKPILVIDLMALFAMFCGDKYSLLCGGQITVIESMAESFFKQLREAGADLVFFYDGSLQPIKYETWCRRQNDKYENMIAIIDAIDQGTPLARVIHRHGSRIPSNTLLKLKRIAKRHGMIIIPEHTECDQALAAYAVEHNALAIISHDTDFLIYQGEWQLWSANYINCTTLETVGYNRQALLRTLRLQWHQMPIFATLAGNDFFKYEEVEPFHNRLGPHHQKFYNLAEYVRSLPVGKKMRQNVINQIVVRMYENRTIPPEAYEWLKQSIHFYSTDSKSTSVNSTMDPTNASIQNANQQFIHSILNGQPFNCTLYFFDYRSPAFGSYFDIVTRIISRIAGIILFHHRQDERSHVLLLVKRSHAELHAQHSVPVEFPAKLVPPTIMEMLAEDSNESEAMLNQKFELLAWVCSNNLPPKPFAALPASLMVVVMALFRLTECGALMLYEADLLLWIAYELSAGKFEPREEQRPYRLDPRAFRVGFLFQKLYAHCARVAKSLGLSTAYRPSTPYDGYRFHNQYSEWRDGRMQSHIQSIAEWRLYRNVARMHD